MDYIRQLGPVVLDHRFRRMTESLLRSAEEIYKARGVAFRGRWTSTYQLLLNEGPLAVGQLADRLRLTHPGVIGITDEMIAADVANALRDPADGRRRMLALTSSGKRMSGELLDIWSELGKAQRRRFTDAGCDIMAVLASVEDGLKASGLAEEVLKKIRRRGALTATPHRGPRKLVARAGRAAICFFVAATIGSTASWSAINAQATHTQGTTSAIDEPPARHSSTLSPTRAWTIAPPW